MLDVSGGAGVVVVVVAAEVKGVPKANATTPAKREAMVTGGEQQEKADGGIFDYNRHR